MTVFVAHAPNDLEAAEGLEKFLERRGQFVELDDGQTALRPVQPSDAVVLLLSKDFVFAPHRLRLEQRALDAWTENRLILVKLDHAFAPVGLRDLPAVDASFEAQREFKWGEIANAVIALLRTPHAAPAGSLGAPPPSAPRKRSGGLLGVFAATLLIPPGLLALATIVSIWLANRIGPAPGAFADLRAGIDAFGVRYGAPGGVTEWLFLAAITIMVITIGAGAANLFARARVKRQALAASDDEPPPPQTEAVFVSYARANAAAVLPVIEAAKAKGRKFWLDQEGIGAGAGWAGEIVRAIRSAKGVLVMCSKAAFESDHVKREIYLADRYHKKLAPIFLEDVEPPEDFEYFFAGVQFLKLFETPEAERSAAVLAVLEAA